MHSSAERNCSFLGFTVTNGSNDVLSVSFISLGDSAHPFPVLSTRLSLCMRVDVMRTTILPWRVVVEQKIAELTRFRQFLRPEERAVFDDLLNQCKLYAVGEAFTSPVKEMSLLFWMIFAQHKKLIELERRISEP